MIRRRSHARPSIAVTNLRIVDLEGRTHGFVRHRNPDDAWAIALNAIAGRPRWLIQPVY